MLMNNLDPEVAENPDALWIVDPGAPGCASFRRGTIDLASLADGDGLPEMSQMALVGERLFVSLQRLDRRTGFVPNGPSWLAVVDTTTDTVTGAIELVVRPRHKVMQIRDGVGRQLVSVGQRQVCAGGAIQGRKPRNAGSSQAAVVIAAMRDSCWP